MGMIKEFREFISRGNVIDLAVGVIIGAAFNAVVKSLVDQVIMPPIGLATGGIDFSQLKYVLKPGDAATKTAEVAIHYGAFINTVIQFLIVAFVIFLMVKGINSLRRRAADEPAAAAAPTASEALLTDIRDLLQAKPTVKSAAAASTVPTTTAAARKPSPKAKTTSRPSTRKR